MAVFTGYLVKFAHEQGEITNRQVLLAKRQIDAAERPWVSVAFAPSGPLTFEKDESSIALKVTLKNTGHTPAVAVTVNAEGYFPASPQEILAKQEDICNGIGMGVDDAKFGRVIFPGDTLVTNETASFSPGEIELGWRHLKGLYGVMYGNPTVGICVSYKFAFEPRMIEGEVHKSAVALQLFRKGEPGGRRIRPDKTVPLDQLLIDERSAVSLGSRAD